MTDFEESVLRHCCVSYFNSDSCLTTGSNDQTIEISVRCIVTYIKLKEVGLVVLI